MRWFVIKNGAKIAAAFRSEEKLRKALERFSSRIVHVETLTAHGSELYAGPALVAKSRPRASSPDQVRPWRFQ